MNSIRITLAALSIGAAGLAQAGEITFFSLPANNSVSRAEVKVETIRAVQQRALVADSIRQSVKARSSSEPTRRGDVGQSALMASSQGSRFAAWDYIGGM
jgi:hypothetical protein